MSFLYAENPDLDSQSPDVNDFLVLLHGLPGK